VTDGDWTKSPTARRVIALWADNRPAWLWSADGNRLVWRNRAARLFGARLKKGDIKLLPNAEPIRGQVPRLMRLGTQGHSSLSRLQFIAGERPISATCAVTPLTLANGQPALLIVGVDAVDSAIFASAGESEPLAAKLLPEGSRFAVLDGDGDIIETSPDLAVADPATLAGDVAEIGGDAFGIERFDAGGGATLLLLTPMERPEEEHPAEEPPARPVEPEAEAEPQTQDMAAWHADETVAPGVQEEAAAPEPAEEPVADKRLTALFDRLAEDENLYTPLGERDDYPPQPVEPTASEAEAPPEPEPEPEAEGEAALAEPAAGDEGARRMLYRLVGRGFTPLAEEASDEEAEAEPAASEAEAEPPEEPAPPRDMESVERVSRYNFDELARILNDRVSGDAAPQNAATSIETIIEAEPEPEPEPAPEPVPAPLPVAAAVKTPASGALINLGGETLVLNRLPLGILVFRDQQVLFANRAITEMIGYESVEQLRAAGLASLFPAASEEMPEAGPINHLVQRDGTLVPVTARLQSVSWQGKPALMLSASTTEVRTGHEGAVRAFAEVLAGAREDGFFDTTRNGIISTMSPQAALLLERGESQLLGRPLTQIVAGEDEPALKAFLERPARFAETARPVLAVRGSAPGTDIMIFAQGQAGITTGYFGFVHRREAVPALPRPAGRPAEIDNGLLGRLSRGIRRPLNTIIGFSDLIGSQAFGEVGNERYVDYAEDIKTAGQEIAALVDELDDFARLRDGRYAPRPSDIDLVTLLDSCVLRVRGEANLRRVLVRSAVSEHLPRIRADRASLAQAVLNLLASAIDQTPAGGAVVLSAQREDDGSISVSVRDSAAREADPSERFVVFRDGLGRDGRRLGPVRSSVGLALTRALLTVNACSLSVDPAGSVGTLFSMTIPAEAVTREELPPPAEEDGTD
jgi:signal transduction histidine kinase